MSMSTATTPPPIASTPTPPSIASTSTPPPIASTSTPPPIASTPTPPSVTSTAGATAAIASTTVSGSGDGSRSDGRADGGTGLPAVPEDVGDSRRGLLGDGKVEALETSDGRSSVVHIDTSERGSSGVFEVAGWKVWPKGGLRFMLGGRWVLGPSSSAFTANITVLLALGTLGLYCGGVAPYLWDLSPALVIFGVMLALLPCYILFRLLITNPGVLPRHASSVGSRKAMVECVPGSVEAVALSMSSTNLVTEPSPHHAPKSASSGDCEASDTGEGKDVDERNGASGVEFSASFCAQCMAYRPPRVYHCSDCKACIRELDHHCVWIGKCVGLQNGRLFNAFVFTGAIFPVYLLAVSIAVVVHLILEYDESAVSLGDRWDDTTTRVLSIVCICCLVVLIGTSQASASVYGSCRMFTLIVLVCCAVGAFGASANSGFRTTGSLLGSVVAVAEMLALVPFGCALCFDIANRRGVGMRRLSLRDSESCSALCWKFISTSPGPAAVDFRKLVTLPGDRTRAYLGTQLEQPPPGVAVACTRSHFTMPGFALKKGPVSLGG